MTARLVERAACTRLLGEFAMELSNRRALRFAGRLLESARMADRLIPVAFVLIDADQVFQCRWRLRVHRDEIGEERLRAIEEAGAHVVLAELEQCDGLLVLVEVRTRDQMLVHSDRAIDLAAAAEQIPKREMRLDRIAIDLGKLQEHLDRLVLLLVQKVIEAAEVVRRQLADARAGCALAAASSEYPARERGDRKQKEKERKRELAHASSGAPSLGGLGPL